MTREELAAAIRRAECPRLPDDPDEREKMVAGNLRLVKALLDPTIGARAPQLHWRERQVILAAANGLTTQETAEELRLSVWTVRDYARRAFARLGVHTMAHAVAVLMLREGA